MKNLAYLFAISIIALTAIHCAHTISGYVRNSDGSGIENVQIRFITQDSTATNISAFITKTDSTGYYEGEVEDGWSGMTYPYKRTFLPKTKFIFDPPSQNHPNVQYDIQVEDYRGARSLMQPPFRPVPNFSTWSQTFRVPSTKFQMGFEVEAGFDLDQDGNKEFALFDVVDTTLTLFEATGNNAFDLIRQYQIPDLASGRASIMVGDLDADKQQELIFFGDRVVGKPAILVWEIDDGALPLSEPTAKLDPPRPRDENNMIKPIRPSTESIVADLDSSGHKDELLLLYTGGANLLMTIVSVDRELSDPGANLVVKFEDSGAQDLRATGVGIGNIDQKGNKEIVIAAERPGIKSIRLYTSGTGSQGQFYLEREWLAADLLVGYRGTSAKIPIVDFNRDGKMEAYVFSNKGKTFFQRPIPAEVWVVELGTNLSKAFNLAHFKRIARLDVTPLRGGHVVVDGNADVPSLYALGTESRKVYQIEYIGGFNGDISDSSNYQAYGIMRDSTSLAPTNMSAVADLDGDGKNEFVMVHGPDESQTAMNGALYKEAIEASTSDAGASDYELAGKPATPSDLLAHRIDDATIELSWKDNADNEENFKVVRDEGSGADTIGVVARDLRHYVDSPAASGSFEYNVLATNAAGKSDLAEGVFVSDVTPSDDEFSVEHENGLIVGDLGGKGIGWSDFFHPIDAGAERQDFLYKGFLLVWSKLYLPEGPSIKIYSGDRGSFVSPQDPRAKITKTTITNYEKTHAEADVNIPVSFQTDDGVLTIGQNTYHELNTKWVLCRWSITNNKLPRHIKFALHLDADAGGERSVLDNGGWDEGQDICDNVDLNIIFQRNPQSGKTIGMAIINGDLGGALVNYFSEFTASARVDLFMTDKPCEPQIATQGDLEMTLVSDLGFVKTNEKKEVAFAIAVCDDLDELRLNLMAARDFLNKVNDLGTN